MSTYCEVVRWEVGIIPAPEAKSIAEIIPYMTEAKDYVVAVEDGKHRGLTTEETLELQRLADRLRTLCSPILP